jgi:hypothetical protein
VLTVLAVLAVFNLAVAGATRLTARRKFLARLEGAPAATRLLFLGNSLFEDGIDTGAFVEAWRPAGQAPAVFSAALHATTPVEHALVLRRALSRLSQVRYLVYGFSDEQMIMQSKTGWGDMISSRALSYAFPDEAAALYAPGSLETKWRFRAMSLLPMLADRTTLWSKVETLRKAMGAVGMPAQASEKEQDLDAVARRLEGVVHADPGFSVAMKEIFRLAQAQGIQVFVVEMPAGHPPAFYEGPASSALRAYNRARVEAQNGVYIDASLWIQDRKYFRNAEHLNPEGAKLFSERLGQEISRRLEGSAD